MSAGADLLPDGLHLAGGSAVYALRTSDHRVVLSVADHQGGHTLRLTPDQAEHLAAVLERVALAAYPPGTVR